MIRREVAAALVLVMAASGCSRPPEQGLEPPPALELPEPPQMRDDQPDQAALRVIRQPLGEVLARFPRVDGLDVELPLAEPALDAHQLSVFARGLPESQVFRQLLAACGLRARREGGQLIVERQDGPGDVPDEQPPWERQIRETLRKRVSFDFIDTSVVDVFQFIRHLTDVTVVVAPGAVAGGAELKVTLKVTDMQLDKALGWICRSAGLDHCLKDGAIFVAKPQVIGRFTMQPRTYDLHDVLFRPRDFPGLSFVHNEAGGTQLPENPHKLLARELAVPEGLEPVLDNGWLTVWADEEGHARAGGLLAQFGTYAAVQDFRERSGQPVCLMLRQVAAAEAIAFLRDVTDLNVVYDPGAEEHAHQALIDLQIINAPAWAAMLHCCRLAGLDCRVEGDLAFAIVARPLDARGTAK